MSDVADRHVATTLDNVVREDGSTWHTFYFNPETGLPERGATCQGYRDGSAWARGQAWGIYGTALACKNADKPEYRRIFRRVADYFTAHLPADMVPFWDLSFTDGDAQPRDSSAASIAACGLLEMARHVPADEGAAYAKLAGQMVKSLCDGYAVRDFSRCNGLVLHSTYSNKSPYNTCQHAGVDECNLWGDYFYMEALTRLSKDRERYW